MHRVWEVFKKVVHIIERIVFWPVVIYEIWTLYKLGRSLAGKVPINQYKWQVVAASGLIVLIIALSIRRYLYRMQRENLQMPDVCSITELEFRDAALSDLAAIVRLDRVLLGQKEVIPEKTFREWLQKNPSVFRLAVCDGDIVGYYSILPLKSDTLDKFIRGKIRERSFRANDIHTVGNMRKLKSLYIFTVIMVPNMGPIAGYRLLEDIARQLDSCRDNGGTVTDLYATAATRRGEEVLKKLRFRPIGDRPQKRKDRHQLYMKRIEPGLGFQSVLSRVSPDQV